METSEKCNEIQKKCTKENSFSHKKSSWSYASAAYINIKWYVVSYVFIRCMKIRRII